MRNIPRSSREDNNRHKEHYSDNGEPSQAAFPIPTIPHTTLHVYQKLLSGKFG
jgi:hypothetical protein